MNRSSGIGISFGGLVMAAIVVLIVYVYAGGNYAFTDKRWIGHALHIGTDKINELHEKTDPSSTITNRAPAAPPTVNGQ